MKKTIFGLAAMLAVALATPALAALPPAAYAGDFWERITGGFTCVGQTISTPSKLVLPKTLFGSGYEPAGVYYYWDNVAKACVRGGAAAGPQL